MPANIWQRRNDRKWQRPTAPHQRGADAPHERILIQRAQRVVEHAQEQLAGLRGALVLPPLPAAVRPLEILLGRRHMLLGQRRADDADLVVAEQLLGGLARRGGARV